MGIGRKNCNRVGPFAKIAAIELNKRKQEGQTDKQA